MSQKIKGIFLQKKDVQLLRYLYGVKVSTYKRIHRDIYKNYTKDSSDLRVRKLEKCGLISGYRTRILNQGEKVLMLTPKGFNAFLKVGTERRVEIKSDAIEHDLSLVDICHKLMKQKKVEVYLTENELQTWGHILNDGYYSKFVKLNSDSLIKMQTPKGSLKVPVEYEAMSKSTTRYMKFMDKYYKRNDIPLVLVICKTESILKQMQRVEKETVTSSENNRPKFFYILMQDFLKNETPEFFSCNNKTLKL